MKDQPTFKELWPEISPYFGNDEYGNFVFAHNATFDINVLLCMMERYNIIPSTTFFGCSLAIARRVFPNKVSYSLESLCRELNIAPGNHDAGEDSRACAEIILIASRERDVNLNQEMVSEAKIEELENKFQIYFGLFDEKGYIPSSCKRLSKAEQIKEIIGDETKSNPDSPFYQKNIVFTGTLSSMKRSDAQQIIADIGGANQTGVNNATDFLVVGQQNFRVVGEFGMSSKQKKAISMVEKGSCLEILSENDFLQMI